MLHFALITCSIRMAAHRYLSLECASISACQFNLNEMRSVCDSLSSLSLPAPPASFQKSLHLPLCFLSAAHSFLFSLSSCYLFIHPYQTRLSFIYFWLLKLGCLSEYVCFAGELVCVRLAAWAPMTVVLLSPFETKGAVSRERKINK